MVYYFVDPFGVSLSFARVSFFELNKSSVTNDILILLRKDTFLHGIQFVTIIVIG